MADFKINVTAETQAAERKLQAVDKAANEATRKRTLNIDVAQIGRDFSNIEKSIKEAGNTIQTFYRVSKNVPGIGDKVQQYENLAKNVAETAKNAPASAAALRDNAKAGSILANSLELAGSKASGLVTNLAKIGFATFAVKQAVGVLQAAFGGFFNETIGREIKLRETILKTQTTLASTNKVFRDGKEITDPYQKIVTLTGEVSKRIDSIRERSIALAGVTSGEVIEVFGIVASQVGQIGGGLKEAEDLAINFAAALGTFGIPLYQARQEIGSILRGDITTDSYLAKALGITNEDVARAKTQAGGIVKFLEDRLSAAVAGQRIAAQGFSGVVSNLKDITELVGQAFGRGLLDPLLTGLTQVFETLFRIRGTLFEIAEGAGRTIGRVSTTVIGLTAGRTGAGQGIDTAKLANNAKDVAQEAFSAIEGIAQRTVGAIALAFTALKPSILVIADAFRVLTKAFLEIKAGTFEALASAVANLVVVLEPAVTVFAGLFNVYARFLDLPGVQYIAELAAVLGLLKRAGLDAATNIALLGRFIVSSAVPAIGALGTFLGTLVAGIGAAIIAVGQLTLALAGLATALITPFNALPAVAAALKDLAGNLTSVAGNTTKAGDSVKGAASSFQVLGSSAKAAGLSIVTSLGWVFLIQVGIAAIVDAFGKYQRAQEEASRTGKAMRALHELSTTYKNVADNADSATKAAVAFRQGLVDTEYNRTIERLEEISSKLNDLEYEARAGIQTWGEFARLLGNFANGDIDPFGGNKEAAQLLAEEFKLREAKKKIEAARDKATLAENISLEADKRVNLEKEIGELRKQQEDQIFQLRQQQAQKEVDIFRIAGELRIFQMEQANAKLIEGEEGASAAALEALNDYLATREKGELDIESAKQQMVIEATNLERQISDYRLENEKKIAEIRKRAGDYEQRVSEYRRQASGQIAAGSGGGAATFGSTGNVNNAAGWVHGHFQTNTGTLSDLVSDVIPVLKALLDQGIPVELSNGTRVAAGKDDAYYRRVLGNAAKQHGHSGDGRSLDLFVPEGTKVPVGLTDIKGNTGRGGITGGLPGSGKSWVGHLAPGSKAGGAAAPAPPPQAPSFADIGAPAVENYAAAVRGLNNALEEYGTLQAALTEAKTAAAFEQIAKAAFPRVNLEQYDDQLKEAKITLDALAASSADAYDPERLKLAVDEKTKIAIQEREIQEIYAKAVEQRNLGKVTEVELQKLKEDLLKKQEAYVKKLADERKLREQVLELSKQQAAIEDLRKARAAISFNVQRAGVQAAGAMAQAYGGDDPLRNRQIEAEIQIAEKRIELEQQYGANSAQAQEELRKFAVETRAAAQVMGQLDEQVQNFQQAMTLVRESAKTITDSTKTMVSSVLKGGNLSEAVGEMGRAIGEKFLGMALDYAFAPMEKLLQEQFKQFLMPEDPTLALQRENNTALGVNTGALDRLATALTTSGQVLPGLPASGGEIQPLPVEPFSPNGELAPLPTGALGQLAPLTENGTAFAQSLNDINKSMEQAPPKAQEANKGFQSFLGGMAGVAAGAMSIAGGIQQLGKGGTSNTLAGIGSIFLGLGSAIGGFGGMGLFGKKAGGGAVSSARPYMVGESGPELFIPSTGGNIHSNQSLREAMGSSPTNNSSSPVLNMSFQTTSIGGVDYVSRDQLEEAMAMTRRQAIKEGARRGSSLALDRLQQSPGTRRRVGLR